MCLAVPMRVVEVDGFAARCEAKGISRTVNLFLLGENSVVPGDHVLVHVGCAIQKLDAEAARSHWALLEEVLRAVEGEGGGGA